MKSNNSKQEEKENKKIITSTNDKKSKIVDNLQEIEKLSIDKLEKKISAEIKIGKKKNHSIYFKSLIVELSRKYEKDGKKLAANFAGCSVSSIYDWEKRYEELKAFRNQNAKRLSGGGKKSVISNYEKEILYYVMDCKKLGLVVSMNSIIAYLYNVHEETKNFEIKNLYMNIYRLLNRNNLSIRKQGRLGQKLPNKAIELFYNFFHYIIQARRELNIQNGEEYRLINCDEIPLYLEMFDTCTIDIKGHKEIIINTKNNEEKRITVLLTICGDGSKLSPFIIFKGKKDKNIDEELKDNKYVSQGKIYAYTQENSWLDKDLFLKWYNKVFLNYEKLIGKSCLLILDKAPSHIDVEILSELKKHNTHYVFIPDGLTRYLQPLDIGVNKIFKETLKKEYLYSENLNKELNFDRTGEVDLYTRRNNIMNLVNKIWFSDDYIKKSAIINSFFKSSITFNIDGSDDEKFLFPEEINEIDKIYVNFNNNLNK